MSMTARSGRGRKSAWVALLAAGVGAVALLAAPSARADIFGAVQLRAGPGALLAEAHGASFAYPADGSLIAVGSIESTPTRVELRKISMLGGSVEADRLLLTKRQTLVEDLRVDGVLRDADVNSIFPLYGSNYLVARQTASIGTSTGFVGLRLVVAPGYSGLPNGGQVLVGLRQRGGEDDRKPAIRSSSQAAGWAVLGFAAEPDVARPPILSDELLPGMPMPGAAWASGTGARAVAIAEQFLGVPYVWAGASPLSGFDCSGLTRFVYAQLGIDLVHYAAAQAHEGDPVSFRQLRPGDLVFFDPSFAGPGHVGIYIGGGRFIHAPHTGDVVKISLLADYASRYAGAVRPYRGA
jgi:NlpC/P60 family protein